jgi:predicted HicB family RNase H-like nuclease
VVKTPQRGRKASAPVPMINVRIDPDLKHELKQAALDARVTTTTFVTSLIEAALDSPGGARAPSSARPAGGATKLGFLIDPELHARLKGAVLDADQTVTEYLTRLIEEAVSAAQGARRGRG